MAAPAPDPVWLPKMKAHLESVFEHYHHCRFVHPDPLEFLYLYDDPRDREIVGMIASSLAFGRVTQILSSVGTVLEQLGRPRKFLDEATRPQLETTFLGFKHRFVTGQELAELLYAIKRVVEQWGTLEAAFREGCRPANESVLPALQRFVGLLRAASDAHENYLLPLPERGSACKRLHLFLRWMVRCDEVDPGGWEHVPRSKLVCPVDTHLHKLGLGLGFTRRKQADGRTAMEITQSLRIVDPDDPVRFDFALSRLGIRRDGSIEEFVKVCGRKFPAPLEC